MIENVETKKRYVGSSTNVKHRLKMHESLIRQGVGINHLMDADIQAGHNKFFAVVLQTFKDGTITNSELSRIERKYSDELGSEGEYNYPGSSIRPTFGRKNPVLYAHGNLERLGMHKPRHCRTHAENDHEIGHNASDSQ